jgi:hypothetical protein
MITSETAKQFMKDIELPPAGLGAKLVGFVGAPPIDYDAQKNQAMVVASDIVAFVKGVSAERRQDIANSSLLAQLVAQVKVPDRREVRKAFDAYYDVLENIGWVIQDKGYVEYQDEADGLEVHDAIMAVATSLLAPAGAAAATPLAVLKSTLDAMKSKDENSPWITLFNQESRYAETGRVQVTLAEQDENGQFLVNSMSFGLKAESTLTQVLWFKIHKDEVKLYKYEGKVTINDDVLSSIRDDIKKKLVGHTGKYFAALPNLPG